MSAEARRFVTLQTASNIFDISYSELYAAVRSGAIEDALQSGRRWRVAPDEVEAWLRRQHDEKHN